MVREARSRVANRRVDAVQEEIAQEEAAALQRAGTRLDDALSRLRAYDVEVGDRTAGGGEERAELVTRAAEALWYYVVQREACGLRDSNTVMSELHVPREVQVRMGTRRGG